jgi:hypothetical protein
MLAIQAGLPNQFLAGGDWLHSNQLERPQMAGTGFGQTVPVQSLVKHSCSRTAQTAVFDQSMPKVKLESTKDFSNTQAATCQLPAFEQVFIAVPHRVTFPVHCRKELLT